MTEAFRPKGSYAVMAERQNPKNKLAFFPTPPWATRALMTHVLTPDDFQGCDVWEPAAGAGHMVGPLGEYFARVYASDVHDYGMGYQVGSFVGDGADVARLDAAPDWIITNPPFPMAIEFVLRAIDEARVGVAMLMRHSWTEGKERYRRIFSVPGRSPVKIAQFAERVPMHKGRWVVNGSSATAYSWFIWRRHGGNQPREHFLIPPTCRRELSRPDDAARFSGVYETKKAKGSSMNTTTVDTSRVENIELRQRIAKQALVRADIDAAIGRVEEPFRARIAAVEDEMAEATRLLRGQLELHDEENAVDDNQALDFDKDTGMPATCCVSGLVLLEGDDIWSDGVLQALAAVLPVPLDEIPAAAPDADETEEEAA